MMNDDKTAPTRSLEDEFLDVLRDAAKRYCPELENVEAEAFATSRGVHDPRVRRILDALRPPAEVATRSGITPGLQDEIIRAIRDADDDEMAYVGVLGILRQRGLIPLEDASGTPSATRADAVSASQPGGGSNEPGRSGITEEKRERLAAMIEHSEHHVIGDCGEDCLTGNSCGFDWQEAVALIRASGITEVHAVAKPDHYDPEQICDCGHARKSHAYTFSDATNRPGEASAYDDACSACEGTDATPDDDVPSEPCERFMASGITSSGAQLAKENPYLTNEPVIQDFIHGCLLSGNLPSNPKRYMRALAYALEKHGMAGAAASTPSGHLTDEMIVAEARHRWVPDSYLPFAIRFAKWARDFGAGAAASAPTPPSREKIARTIDMALNRVWTPEEGYEADEPLLDAFLEAADDVLALLSTKEADRQ